MGQQLFGVANEEVRLSRIQAASQEERNANVIELALYYYLAANQAVECAEDESADEHVLDGGLGRAQATGNIGCVKETSNLSLHVVYRLVVHRHSSIGFAALTRVE